MVTCKEIDDYIAYMDAHPTWINKDRRLLIENVVRPLMARDDVTFDDHTYHNCIRYCEANYYPLFPYQKFIYAFVFMYFSDGTVCFRKIFVMEGRGNGKDGLMAPLANFLQTPLYGVPDYNIELVANSEQQIKDTFKIPYDMLAGNPKFRGKFSVTKELIKNLTTGSELRFNSSNGKTADGKRPGCVFFNEYHAYENYDTISVYESAAGKVKHFREIIITTQGFVRDGPLDDLLTLSRKILDTGDNPTRVFPFLCRLDKEEEADDENAWHKANPSLEYMPNLRFELKMLYLDAKATPSKWPEYMTKRMDLPAIHEETAVTSWDNILRACYADIKRKTPRPTADTTGNLAIIGIDYADVRDFASAGILTKDDDDNYIWRQHTWICAHSPFLKGVKFPIDNAGQPEFRDFEVTEDPVIPVSAIVAWCLDRMTDHTVVKVSMDAYRYSLFKELFSEAGISIESKDNPQGVVRLIRKVRATSGIIAPTIEKLFSEGKIDFGASAIMRWYTNNTSIIIDRYGNYSYGKVEPVRRKTDGFMAFVAAMYSSDLLKENVIYV